MNENKNKKNGFNRSLHFTRVCDQTGKQMIAGAANLFLRNFYNKDTAYELKTYTKKDGSDGFVGTANASVALNDNIRKDIKYWFDVDLPETGYLNIRVTCWNALGQRLEKFHLTTGSHLIFLARNFSMESFPRKDGSTGWQLEVTPYDFIVQKSASSKSENNAGDQGYQESENIGLDDFAEVEDDDCDDLPF